MMARKRVSVRSDLSKYVLLGALNAAIPFVLISFAEVVIPASLAAILNATTPLFTAIIARLWLKEPLPFTKVGGLILGFSGVAVLVGWTPVPLNARVLLAVSCSLMAAALYGVGSIYAKLSFRSTPLELSIGQLLGSALVLMPFVPFEMPDHVPTTGTVVATLALSLASTAFAYLLYFQLLTEVGPTQTLYVTFLVPVFGVFWGMIFLHETVNAGTLAGFFMILAGLFLLTGNRFGKRKKWLSQASSPTGE
jgi:drug/metabolite transporter (DMT)-like permease